MSKPDYNLCVKMRKSNEMGRIGVAWKGKDGAINIKINPGAYIDYALSQHAYISLFPINQPKPSTTEPNTPADADMPF